MGMKINDKIKNGNGQEWDTTCMVPIAGCRVWLMFWLEKERYCFSSKSNTIQHIFSVVCNVR